MIVRWSNLTDSIGAVLDRMARGETRAVHRRGHLVAHVRRGPPFAGVRMAPGEIRACKRGLLEVLSESSVVVTRYGVDEAVIEGAQE